MSEGKVTMDHRYAREKLTALVRDLDQYTADEFWRQMSRIAAGATGADHAEEIAKARDALAAHVDELTLCLSAISNATEGGYDLNGDEIEDIELLLERTPVTSLARFKAQWQAEALEVAAEDKWSSNDMCLYAAQLRRQAEDAQ